LFGKEGMAFLRALSLPENYKIALEGYLSVLEMMRHEIRVTSRKVQQVAKEDGDAVLLMTIPGVGFYSALLIKVKSGMLSVFPQQNRYPPMLVPYPLSTPMGIPATMGT